MSAVLRVACDAPAVDNLTAVARRAEEAALEADVRAALDAPGGAARAHGRLLARLTGGTATQNAAALDDILAAAQRVFVRAQGGR